MWNPQIFLVIIALIVNTNPSMFEKLPDSGLRGGFNHMDFLAAYRMHKRHLSGVQADPSIRVGSRESVLQIPFDVNVACGKLSSDLMVSTGKKPDG